MSRKWQKKVRKTYLLFITWVSTDISLTWNLKRLIYALVCHLKNYNSYIKVARNMIQNTKLHTCLDIARQIAWVRCEEGYNEIAGRVKSFLKICCAISKQVCSFVFITFLSINIEYVEYVFSLLSYWNPFIFRKQSSTYTGIVIVHGLDSI